MPLTFPIIDPKTGEETRELFIKKGTSVYVGLAPANRSKAIWGPDADLIKPERWVNKFEGQEFEGVDEKIKLPGILSNVYVAGVIEPFASGLAVVLMLITYSMTFLGGGRACPGMKYAFLEMSTCSFIH